MFCINCGKQLEEGSRFCPYCGARVPDVSAGASGNPTYSAGQPGGGAGDPSVNSNASNPFQPQNPAGADQGQPGAGYWSQPNTGDPGQTGTGYQSQPGNGTQNQSKAGFDPWSMKGAQTQKSAGPQDDPWGVRGGAAAAPAAQPAKKKRHTVRNVILIVLGVIVLALVGLYILGSTVTGKYEPVIESYLSYAEDGDMQRVESLFYPDVFETYTEMYTADYAIYYADGWTKYYGAVVDHYEISEVDQEEDELKEFNIRYGLGATEYADVTVNVFYEDGRYTCMDFEMVEVNDSWYLVYIW